MVLKVDHFSFTIQDTFKLRYLINDTWRKQQNAPIFFYTGNEGNIEVFAQNTVRAISCLVAIIDRTQYCVIQST